MVLWFYDTYKNLLSEASLLNSGCLLKVANICGILETKDKSWNQTTRTISGKSQMLAEAADASQPHA